MSKRIDLAHAKLELSELLIAKALKVDELTQIARIETRLREFLFAKWNARAKIAIQKAAAATTSGKSISTVVGIIDKTMAVWPSEVVPTFNKGSTKIYELGRKVGFKRATGQIKGKRALAYTTENFSGGEQVVVKAAAEVFPGFDVIDEGAIDALHDNNTFWIGEHYDRNVSESISKQVSDTIIKHGKDRVAAGKELLSVLQRQFGIVSAPTGYAGSSKSYFEGLSANAATVARVSGQVRSFEQFDVTTFEIVNPGDERTSKICQHMNGKVFTVKQARAQLDEELAAKSPEDIKKIHPWMSVEKLQVISPKPGPAGEKDAKALAAAGVALPPFHFRCRSTVDVSF